MTDSPFENQATQPSFEPQPPPMSLSQEHLVQNAIRLLRKRGWIALACMALGLLGGIVANMVIPRQYKSDTNILITSDSASQFRLDDAAPAAGVDSVKIDTEIEILRSPTLALQTIGSLHLENNPNFIAPRTDGRKWSINRTDDRHSLAGNFLGALAIQRVGHTNLINLSVTTRDPNLSATIANKLIENYKEHSFQDNYESTEEVSRWLQTQLGGLKERLTISQSKVLALQEQVGLVGIDQEMQSTAVARLDALNRDMVAAENQRLVLEGKLVALKSASPEVIDTLVADPIMVQLRQRRSVVSEQYNAANAKYGPNHPRVQEAKEQLDEVDKSIQKEEGSLLIRGQKELESARSTENALNAAIEREKAETFKGNSKVVQYALARREYESARELYDGLEQRLEEAGIMAGLHSTSIRVVDAAEPPDGPTVPRKRLNNGIGLAVGFFLGALIIVLIESLDTNIKTISDVEEAVGLPLLGIIPKADTTNLAPQDFVSSSDKTGVEGWSQVAEAYRAFRTSLLLSRAGSPPQVLLISSSRPAEGKTSAASLASTILAMSGARVLLIDADLRRASVHTRFHIPNRAGLATVLSGKQSFDAVVQTIKDVPTLNVLTAGPTAPLPAELLSSSVMRELVTSLRQRYDFILIDTPPVLTVTDAAVLAPLVDGAVLVVRYGQTPKNAIARSAYLLDRSGAHVLGALLNAVDYTSPDYSEYYGRSYTEYYGRKPGEESGS